MLKDGNIIGFVMTTDAVRARSFYEGVLGLTVVSEDDFALVLDANGTMVRVSKTKELATAPHTVLGWAVADIAAEVHGLTAKGVAFERYGFLEQDAAGIWNAPASRAKVAWFKDPEGNVLSLTQF